MSIQKLLGIPTSHASDAATASKVYFSLFFFSDTRPDIPDSEKYAFVRDLTIFGDREGFRAVYLPERHFHEFGAIFPNSAIMAAHLIPQTRNIRFRTAGISLPLHHPTEVVEWWSMNDILSNGRVDLGFGSGWNKPDFILAPENYENRREIMSERIEIVKKLWRNERVRFKGPNGEIDISVYPRPIQKELNIWILVAQNDEGFIYAGKQGYNIFTMLYGNDLEALRAKIALYRSARREAGFNPNTGIVSLMLHTLIGPGIEEVKSHIEKPFKKYIQSSMGGHLKNGAPKDGVSREFDLDEQQQILEYAFQRYVTAGALFGSVEDGERIAAHAIEVGVNEIACLMDFGVDYSVVKKYLPYLKALTLKYK